jgi:hypothetical protein
LRNKAVNEMAETFLHGPDGPAKPSPDSTTCRRHLIVARQDCDATGDGARCLIRLQVFNPDGSACGPEITLDAATAGNLFHPAIAALADGRFVLAWEEALGSDPSAQRALRVRVLNADGSPWGPALPLEVGAAGS